MSASEIVQIAVQLGYQVDEYPSHFLVKADLQVQVLVTVPKVSLLVGELLQKIKSRLNF